MIDEYKYNILKKILSGCNSKEDAIYFGNIYIKLNINMKLIYETLIDNSNFNSQFSFNEIINIIKNYKQINNYKIVKNDAYIFENMLDNNKILETIFKRITEHQLNNNVPNETKKCPHCDLNTFVTTKYIICGYIDEKLTTNGCYKDWCGKCGKKLCKEWVDNCLFNECNRYHTNNCCLIFAHKNNLNINDYCSC